MSNTRVFKIWVHMRERCTSATAADYPRYGGRGIKVCARWQVFETFLADMGVPPVGHSIERIDNDGDYAPGNCRWATTREQAQNRHSSRVLEHAGRRLTVSQWADVLGVSYRVLLARLRKG